MSWVTMLGGSIMPPEVLQAMVEAADCYVSIDELNQKAGEVIAHHTGAEAGLVTSGAAGGMLLEAAACMTGTDRAKIAQLPNTDGMKNEIIIHRSHRFGFDQAFRMAGAKLIEVGMGGTSFDWELESAFNENTAAVAYIFGPWFRCGLSLPEVVEIASNHGVPVIVDAAAMLPPKENLSKFITQGADMVSFSGGKGLCGPQSTGVLCGRGDLVEAARLNMSPMAGVGRPAKVCKEEIVGLIVALERFVSLDHDEQWARWQAMSMKIVEKLQDIEGLDVRLEESDPNRFGPQAVIYFQQSWQGPSSTEVQATLRSGDISIYIGQGGYRDELWVNPATLKDGEEEVVADRLRKELTRQQSD
jgi:L-seryl-tRNA(Ser) seleniumtransferase